MEENKKDEKEIKVEFVKNDKDPKKIQEEVGEKPHKKVSGKVIVGIILVILGVASLGGMLLNGSLANGSWLSILVSLALVVACEVGGIYLIIKR